MPADIFAGLARTGKRVRTHSYVHLHAIIAKLLAAILRALAV
jgi:hypothetical protein